MRLRSHSALIACVAVGLAIGSAPASAGVHVDPNGPAGAQYSAPLGQARVDASGGQSSGAVPGSHETPPLFGEGIKPAAHQSRNSRGAGTPTAKADTPSRAAIAVPEGGSSVLGIAGIALAVLAVGAGVGIAAIRFGPSLH